MTDLAVVGPVSGDHLRRFTLALAEATKPTDGTMQATPPRAEPGRPPRNVYECCEIAYMADIEERDEFVPPAWVGRAHGDTYRSPDPDAGANVTTQRAYLDREPNLRWEPEPAQADRWRCRGLHRYRQEGREMLAALGAEPWCEPD